MGYVDMDWMEECIKQVKGYEMLQKDGGSFGVMCRASFAKGFLAQCEGYGQVVALLDAILEPLKKGA